MSDGGGEGGGGGGGGGGKGTENGDGSAPGNYSGPGSTPMSYSGSDSGSSAPAPFSGGDLPGLPGVSASAGAIPMGGVDGSPPGLSGSGAVGGGQFDNLPGLTGGETSYLNAPGVTSIGGTSAGGALPGPGVDGATTFSGAPNVITGSGGGGPAASSGLPGLGDAAAAAPAQSGKPGGTAAGSPEKESVLTSLGIKNPIGTAIGAAGLGYAMTQAGGVGTSKGPAFTPEMAAAARSLDANGQKLMSYLQSGDLPPGLKTSLDQATASAKAKIVSNFAAQGLNTDPTQNSVLAAQLAQVDQQAVISTAQIGQQLMSSGLAQSGLSSDLYKTLSNIDATQSAAIGKAIANFAAASAGSGGGGINLKVA